MSSNKFDSIFTQAIYKGSNNTIPTPVSGYSSTNSKGVKYNDLIWKSLQPRTENSGALGTGSFFIVGTIPFSSVNGQKIRDAINKNSNLLYFDMYGSIGVLNDNKIVEQVFKNPLHSKIIGTDGNINLQDIYVNPRPDFIISENGKWFLVTNTDNFQVIYNPIHRKSFKEYYQSFIPNKNDITSNLFSYDGLTLKNSTSNKDNNIANLMDKYCEITSNSGSKEKGIRNYADVVCRCMSNDECIDDSMGGRTTDNTARNSMGNLCYCGSNSCKGLNSAGNPIRDDDSFVTDTNLGFAEIVKSNSKIKCDSKVEITICSVNFSSSGGITAKGVTVDQNCGGSKPEPPKTDSGSTTGSTSTTGTNSSGSASSSGSSTSSGSTAGGKTGATSTSSSGTSSQKETNPPVIGGPGTTTPTVMTPEMITIIVVLVGLVVGGGFFMSKLKTKAAATGTTPANNESDVSGSKGNPL